MKLISFLFTAVDRHLGNGEICYFFRRYIRPIYEAKSLINIQNIFADCRVAVSSFFNNLIALCLHVYSPWGISEFQYFLTIARLDTSGTIYCRLRISDCKLHEFNINEIYDINLPYRLV